MHARIAGVLIPLFSLRTEGDLGIGDISALKPMTDLAVRMGHRAVLMLPVDETAPGNASPYSALSLFAIDPIYISTAGLPSSVRARAKGAAAMLTGVTLADRIRIRTARLEILEAAFREFRAGAGNGDREAAERFAVDHREWIEDYALFRALKERFQWKAWEEWPAEVRGRDPSAIEAARRDLAEPIAKYVYWQFLAHREWADARAYARARGVMLGGDLAFSPGRDSAEVWSNQRMFDLPRSVGAPPDAFSVLGQRWGLPMPQWDLMRGSKMELLRARVRHARSLFDFVRIDHVVGLYRTYSFGPEPEEAGEFLPSSEAAQNAQGEEIMRAVLEEAGDTAVIAEDLGVIPPFVSASLAAMGIPGYKVMRWEKINWGRPDERYIKPSQYPELSLAVTGTHDTETFSVWWRETAVSERVQFVEALGNPPQLDPASDTLSEAALDTILAALYAAPSRMTIVPMQDLFGWEDRINLPGTVGIENWTWRLPWTLEHALGDADIGARLARLKEIATRAKR